MAATVALTPPAADRTGRAGLGWRALGYAAGEVLNRRQAAVRAGAAARYL